MNLRLKEASLVCSKEALSIQLPSNTESANSERNAELRWFEVWGTPSLLQETRGSGSTEVWRETERRGEDSTRLREEQCTGGFRARLAEAGRV